MLKLHFNPGSCSLASHAALGEAVLPYEPELVDLTKNVQFSDEYRKKNPWARVPALQTDDQILTEHIAILSYIAGLVPQTQLLPVSGRSDEHTSHLQSLLRIPSAVMCLTLN